MTPSNSMTGTEHSVSSKMWPYGTPLHTYFLLWAARSWPSEPPGVPIALPILNATLPTGCAENLSEYPLLAEWMPFVYDQNSHTRESFIGKTAEGNYRYLIAATNDSGNVAYIHIQDTQFSILPTACPIPILLAKGDIRHISPSIADTLARRAYIVYCDTSNRVYVLAAEYDKSPAPLTLYYTDPLPEFGDCTPVLTADGNIMMAGGIIDNNFSPQASVWLLPVAGDDRILQSLMPTESQKAKTWWLWLLIGVAIVGGGLLTVKRKKKNDSQTQSAVATSDSQTQNATTTSDNDLMERIIELMESEKLYLKPDLQLSHLADILEVHSNTKSTNQRWPLWFSA